MVDTTHCVIDVVRPAIPWTRFLDNCVEPFGYLAAVLVGLGNVLVALKIGEKILMEHFLNYILRCIMFSAPDLARRVCDE